MAVNDLFRGLNEACLIAFGQAYTLTRSEIGEWLSVDGILEEGAEPEGVAPGDGSIYARFWTRADNIDPPPELGDEISTDAAIYKILRMERDGGGGLILLLRQDRLVE